MVSTTSARRRGTRARDAVWGDSRAAPVRFTPLARKAAARLYHQARAFERQTRPRGQQDGALGRNALRVLEVLLFDCLNYASGRLDPARATIARLGNLSLSSVQRGLNKLRAAGVIDWVRRCAERIEGGRLVLEQLSNAYTVLPVAAWLGFIARPAAPRPAPGTWGDEPYAARDGLTDAVALLRAGGGAGALVAALDGDRGDRLAQALARLGRRLIGAESSNFSGGSN